MKKHFRFLTFLLSALFIVGCNPNDDGSSSNASDPFTQNFGAAVSRDFMGQVVDQYGVAIQNAEIKIGNKTTQTDVNGVFIIKGAGVYKRFAYITSKKSGFIDGSRAMVPTSGINNVKIMMIANTPVQIISSGVASEVTLPNGTTVNFDGAFQDENGNAYTGDVQVAMYHLEASNENLSSLMPGMLYAKDESGAEKVLETYGMMNVELKGSNGQKLQIASGHTAGISMAIDATQLATAPNTIPLWHFDDAKGYWIEEGSATKVGNAYVGTVSHFSWWNCDIPNSTILLTINIHDNNGNPLVNQIIELTDQNGYSTFGLTDSNGQTSGLIPENSSLVLQVYASNYSTIIYNSAIGPFVTDAVVNIVIEGSPALIFNQVTGNLVNCENTNVTNGYMMLIREGYSSFFFPVNNGQFSFNTVRTSANETFSLRGGDYNTSNYSEAIVYSYSNSATTNVGNFAACNPITEFISYQIDSNPTVIMQSNLTFTIDMNNYLSVFGRNNELGKEISIDGQAGGTGANAMLGFVLQGTDFGVIRSGGTNTITYNAAPIGAVGTYADVTFNGTFTDTTGTHTLSGLIHVIRDN
ncbi:hypothetical protein FSS13T_19040 [Flavobacterium saliperosum S13]|uniref:Carboxypeptidase regulatory-like domain-containing protein n=2 Tax=Flavobacterium saliperosum TaxID=329186 RepID=A0A1G4W823_9FLAO|nr:hypothetical protein [Flavobacterium saliperosum]ESU24674.1 hypothetical protein FSS13T_19040 [Flavobacterium saliperosum S13]SCX18303.1 hypothetical protein SAMN02927925_02665 [Flavobacterium saliperosum]